MFLEVRIKVWLHLDYKSDTLNICPKHFFKGVLLQFFSDMFRECQSSTVSLCVIVCVQYQMNIN